MLRHLAAHLAPAGAAADGADGDDAEVAVGAVPGVAHYTDPASGARTLIRTLVANDVTVCFSNPGTSEMHFVAGLDSEPEMRPVLVLQEVRLPCRIRCRCRCRSELAARADSRLPCGRTSRPAPRMRTRA